MLECRGEIYIGLYKLTTNVVLGGNNEQTVVSVGTNTTALLALAVGVVRGRESVTESANVLGVKWYPSWGVAHLRIRMWCHPSAVRLVKDPAGTLRPSSVSWRSFSPLSPRYSM